MIQIHLILLNKIIVVIIEFLQVVVYQFKKKLIMMIYHQIQEYLYLIMKMDLIL